MGGKRQKRQQGNSVFRDGQKLTTEKVEKATSDFLSLNSVLELCNLLKISREDLFSIFISKYTKFQIHKKNKVREIQKPSKLLSQTQKKLSYYLNCIYLYEIDTRKINSSFAYIPTLQENKTFSSRKNIVNNARVHTNKKLVANIDLEDFFKSIKKSKIQEIFKKSPFNFNEELVSFISLIVTHENSLPVGAPTSPILSNFIMLDIDDKFNDIPNISYSRFSDDLTFSTDYYSISDFEKMLSMILNTVVLNGFKINFSKTSIKKSTDKQVVTGLVVNKKTNVDRRYIRNIRAILYSIENIGFEQAAIKYAAINYEKFLRSIKRYFIYHNLYLSEDVINKHIFFGKEWYFLKSLRAKIEHIGYVKGKDDHVYNRILQVFLNLIDKHSNSIIYNPKLNIKDEVVYVTNATANSIVFYSYCFLKNSGLNDFEIMDLRKKFNFKDSNVISFEEILKNFQNQSAYFINLYNYMLNYNRFENFIDELESQDNFKKVFNRYKDSDTLKKQYYRKVFHTDINCEYLKSDYAESDNFHKNTGVFFDLKEELKDKYYVLDKSFLESLKMRNCLKC